MLPWLLTPTTPLSTGPSPTSRETGVRSPTIPALRRPIGDPPNSGSIAERPSVGSIGWVPSAVSSSTSAGSAPNETGSIRPSTIDRPPPRTTDRTQSELPTDHSAVLPYAIARRTTARGGTEKDRPLGVLVSEVVQETLCVFCDDEGASLPRTMNESSEDEQSESFAELRRRKHVSEHRERTRATSRGSRACRGLSNRSVPLFCLIVANSTPPITPAWSRAIRLRPLRSRSDDCRYRDQW